MDSLRSFAGEHHRTKAPAAAFFCVGQRPSATSPSDRSICHLFKSGSARGSLAVQ
jgi:hypothetical protein